MGYKLRNGGIPHTRPQLCILTPRPLLQVLTVYPSLQVLTPSPHSKSSLQVLTVYPSLETLNPIHQYISFTRDPQSNPPIYILHPTPHTYTIHLFYYYLLNHHTIYLITTNMYESLPMYIFTPPTYFSFSFFSSFLLPFYLSFLFSFV